MPHDTFRYNRLNSDHNINAHKTDISTVVLNILYKQRLWLFYMNQLNIPDSKNYQRKNYILHIVYNIKLDSLNI